MRQAGDATSSQGRGPRPWLFVMLVLVASAASAVAEPLSAGRRLPPLEDDHPFRDQVAIPNIPDARECARACEQDSAPCDPWLFKKADGRCTPEH